MVCYKLSFCTFTRTGNSGDWVRTKVKAPPHKIQRTSQSHRFLIDSKSTPFNSWVRVVALYNTRIMASLVSDKVPVIEILRCWPHVISPHLKPSSVVVSGEISSRALCSKASNHRAPIHIGFIGSIVLGVNP